MIRNVIFDWSGTLVDDLPAVWLASNHVFQKAGLEPMTLERFRAEFRLPFSGFYQEYLPHIPLPQLELWFHECFSTAQSSVRILPYAEDFLHFCRSKNLRTFLLSAVHPKHFQTQCDALRLRSYFDKTYLGIADKRNQIQTVLEENGLNPEETVFIGDMQHDIETAHQGGTQSVAVLTGYNSLTQLQSSKPDLIVEHLGELQRHLEHSQLKVRADRPRARHPIPTVGALIFDAENRMLLVRTSKWSDLWGIPGGKIEWGEDSETALRRELLEETGLEVEGIRFVLVQDAVNPPEFYREAHFILLNYVCQCRQGQQVRLNDEAQEFRWVTREDSFRLALNTPTKVLLKSLT